MFLTVTFLLSVMALLPLHCRLRVCICVDRHVCWCIADDGTAAQQYRGRGGFNAAGGALAVRGDVPSTPAGRFGVEALAVAAGSAATVSAELRHGVAAVDGPHRSPSVNAAGGRHADTQATHATRLGGPDVDFSSLCALVEQVRCDGSCA
jgi:hypothetical protein